ncbi:MAG: hypothetical protein M0D55_05815 [Elusimicrobiota bacterium]|nr:MAG: hypothetical protein M0D55_05815 [Elusimicrobiota bacterium]
MRSLTFEPTASCTIAISSMEIPANIAARIAHASTSRSPRRLEAVAISNSRDAATAIDSEEYQVGRLVSAVTLKKRPAVPRRIPENSSNIASEKLNAARDDTKSTSARRRRDA